MIECTKDISMWLMWASTECEWFWVLHIQQSTGCIVTSFQSGCIGRCYCQKGKWQACCHILKISINGVSTIFGIASWNIQYAVRLQNIIIELSAAFRWNNGGGNISTMSWKWASTERQPVVPLHLRKCMRCAAMLPHNCAIGRLSRQNLFQQHRYYVLKISINGASTTFGLVWWKILGLCSDIEP